MHSTKMRTVRCSGCHGKGGVCRGCLPGGCVMGGVCRGGVRPGGVCQTPPVDRMTDARVKTLPCHKYIADGKNHCQYRLSKELDQDSSY